MRLPSVIARIARVFARALGHGRQIPILKWFVRLGIGLSRHNAFLAASAMAFNFFLSVIPTVALLGFILSHLVRKRGLWLLEPLGDAIPFAKEIGAHELDRMANMVAVAPISILGFLWVTSTGTSSLIDTFEVALGAKRRAWWVQRMIAVTWVLSVIAATTATIAAAISIDTYLTDTSFPVHRRIANMFGSREPWIVLAVLILVGVCALAVLYRYGVVHLPGRKRVAWPGAIVATISACAVTWLFGLYVRNLASYAIFYGSLAAVATILVWLYLISLALLVGAELNAQIEIEATPSHSLRREH